MLKERNAERHAALERELAQLSYRRLLLCRQIEEADKRIGQVEGALAENEAAKRDLETQATIDAATAAREADNA